MAVARPPFSVTTSAKSSFSQTPLAWARMRAFANTTKRSPRSITSVPIRKVLPAPDLIDRLDVPPVLREAAIAGLHQAGLDPVTVRVVLEGRMGSDHRRGQVT